MCSQTNENWPCWFLATVNQKADIESAGKLKRCYTERNTALEDRIVRESWESEPRSMKTYSSTSVALQTALLPTIDSLRMQAQSPYRNSCDIGFVTMPRRNRSSWFRRYVSSSIDRTYTLYARAAHVSVAAFGSEMLHITYKWLHSKHRTQQTKWM